MDTAEVGVNGVVYVLSVAGAVGAVATAAPLLPVVAAALPAVLGAMTVYRNASERKAATKARDDLRNKVQEFLADPAAMSGLAELKVAASFHNDLSKLRVKLENKPTASWFSKVLGQTGKDKVDELWNEFETAVRDGKFEAYEIRIGALDKRVVNLEIWRGDVERRFENPTAATRVDKWWGTSANPDEDAKAKTEDFEPVRREWVLERIREWAASKNWTRAFVLKGSSGMGKSVLASTLFLAAGEDLARPRDADHRTSLGKRLSRTLDRSSNRPKVVVGAAHFFNYADDESSDLRQVFASLAKQLGRFVPGLEETIAKKKAQVADARDVDKLSAEDLFKYLVAAPCTAVPPPTDLRVVIIFDAFDECRADERRKLMRLLHDHFLKLAPAWLGSSSPRAPRNTPRHSSATFGPPCSTRSWRRTRTTFGPTSRAACRTSA
jgi:hypothetical protein